MPKFEPHELQDGLTEPLEFTLAGEEIVIERVDPEVFHLVTKDMEGMDGRKTLAFMDKLMAKLIGESRYKEIRGRVDLRELNAVFRWLQEQIWQSAKDLGEPEKNSEGTPGE